MPEVGIRVLRDNLSRYIGRGRNWWSPITARRWLVSCRSTGLVCLSRSWRKRWLRLPSTGSALLSAGVSHPQLPYRP